MVSTGRYRLREYTCAYCGKAFWRRGERRHPERACCSRECKREHLYPKAVCKTCGKTFRWRRYDVRNQERGKQYCSMECYYYRRGEPLPSMECAWCGKEVQRYRGGVSAAGRVFCCRDCVNRFKLRENRGVDDGIVRCVVCGEPVKARPGGHYSKTCGRDACLDKAWEQGCLKAEAEGRGDNGGAVWRALVREHGEEWYASMRRALDNFKLRHKGRIKRDTDPWRRRLGNIVKSQYLRKRELDKLAARQKTVGSRRIGADWQESLRFALSRFSNRQAYATRMANPWFRRFDSAARNWRRKELVARTEAKGGDLS